MTDSDLVKFAIPCGYVLAHVLPTEREISYGYKHGWLSGPDAVAIAEFEMAAGLQLGAGAERLALLLSDESYKVAEILSEVDAEGGNEWRVWLFLALAWLYDNRDDWEDPYQVIEMLYTDFGYPEEIASFVRFLPAPDGEVPGTRALEERWIRFINTCTDSYAGRSWKP